MSGDRTARPFLQTEFNEAGGRLSPNGLWMAYSSDESGRTEVYVRSFPESARKRQISSNGGSAPQWRRDGRELFYVAADETLMAAQVQTHSSIFDASTPQSLFRTQSPSF